MSNGQGNDQAVDEGAYVDDAVADKAAEPVGLVAANPSDVPLDLGDSRNADPPGGGD